MVGVLIYLVGVLLYLSTRQYEWFKVSERNTLADESIGLSSGWHSSSGKSVVYKRPPRNYARLLTPTELVFDRMGESAGRAAAGFATITAKIIELDIKIKAARKAYFTCYPKCQNIDSLAKNYSKSLSQKDSYFYELSGQPSFIGQLTRYGAIVTEGVTGGNSGISLVDGGIPSVCAGLFSRWSREAGKSFQASAGTQQQVINKSMESILKLLSGDMQSIQKQGRELANKQELALLSARPEYGKYQVCRDNFEFDKHE